MAYIEKRQTKQGIRYRALGTLKVIPGSPRHSPPAERRPAGQNAPPRRYRRVGAAEVKSRSSDFVASGRHTPDSLPIPDQLEGCPVVWVVEVPLDDLTVSELDFDRATNQLELRRPQGLVLGRTGE